MHHRYRYTDLYQSTRQTTLRYQPQVPTKKLLDGTSAQTRTPLAVAGKLVRTRLYAKKKVHPHIFSMRRGRIVCG